MDHPDQEPKEEGYVPSEVMRAGMRVGLLLVIPSAAMLLALPRHSPEFIISAFTLAIGVFFLIVVIGGLWVLDRRT